MEGNYDARPELERQKEAKSWRGMYEEMRRLVEAGEEVNIPELRNKYNVFGGTDAMLEFQVAHLKTAKSLREASVEPTQVLKLRNGF